MRRFLVLANVRPMITIGVTGHRPHRLIVSQGKLQRRVRSVLTGLIRAASDQPEPGSAVLDVNSALAEGADQIVAGEALALGQRLTALLPFCRSDYEATFSDRTLLLPFRDLWRKADKKVELDGCRARPQAAYVAVGALTLARADIILTLWDGKPAQGRGGTPEVLQGALEWGIPIIWIDAMGDRKPVVIAAARWPGRVPDLARIARKAKPVSQALYRELIAAARLEPHR